MTIWLLAALLASSARAADCPDPARSSLQATTELAMLRLRDAEVALDRLRDGMACAATLEPQAVARYFQLQGVLYVHQGANTELGAAERARLRQAALSAFAASKRIAPDDWNPDLGTGEPYDVFVEARAAAGTAVPLVLENLEPGEWVAIDGAVVQAPLEIAPGLHVVQVGTTGKPARFAREFEARGQVTMKLPPSSAPTTDWRTATVTIAAGERVAWDVNPDVDTGACEATSNPDIGRLIDQVEVEIGRDRASYAREYVKQLDRRLVCLTEPALPSHLARYARAKALFALEAQASDQARGWAWMAEKAAASVPWTPDMPVDHPVRALLADVDPPEPAGPPGKGLAAPKKGGVFWNGRPLEVPVAPDFVPALVQVADKGEVTAAGWQLGGAFPDHAVGPPGPALAAPGWYRAEDLDAVSAALGKRYAEWPPEVEQVKQQKQARGKCEPITAADFAAQVAVATAAVDAHDVVGHANVHQALKAQVSCMEEAVPTDAWARFLVGLAVLEQRSGGSWQEPLTTALRIAPDVDRDGAPPVVRDYVPPRLPLWERPLPDDAEIWIDGRPVRAVGEFRGVHIVQRRARDRWEGRWLREDAFPREWLEEMSPYEARPTVTVALLAGLGRTGQAVDNPGFVRDTLGTGGNVGLASWGALPATGNVGFAWDLAASPTALLQADTHLGLELGGRTRAFLGAGYVGVEIEAPDGASAYRFLQPHLGVNTLLDAGDRRIDLGVGGGAAGGAMHVRGRAAVVQGMWLAGLEGAWSQARFVDAAVAGREVLAVRARVGLAVGVRL